MSVKGPSQKVLTAVALLVVAFTLQGCFEKGGDANELWNKFKDHSGPLMESAGKWADGAAKFAKEAADKAAVQAAKLKDDATKKAAELKADAEKKLAEAKKGSQAYKDALSALDDAKDKGAALLEEAKKKAKVMHEKAIEIAEDLKKKAAKAKELVDQAGVLEAAKKAADKAYGDAKDAAGPLIAAAGKQADAAKAHAKAAYEEIKKKCGEDCSKKLKAAADIYAAAKDKADKLVADAKEKADEHLPELKKKLAEAHATAKAALEKAAEAATAARDTQKDAEVKTTRLFAMQDISSPSGTNAFPMFYAGAAALTMISVAFFSLVVRKVFIVRGIASSEEGRELYAEEEQEGFE